ncbi:MAG: PAS domain-containing sensor histidine kinase [Acidobacteria bacterium]|nr:PAS domain-containing sensor histidine kinase [Acidobacteriota bacterium]
MTPGSAPARSKLTHDRHLLYLALSAGLPGSFIALVMLWFGDHTPKVQWTLTTLIVSLWLGFAFSVRRNAVLPLQTLSNLIAALREGDFSIRARGGRRDDPLGEAMTEVNALSEMLREQRLGSIEATAFLSKVMGEIDVAIFAFDGERKLRLVNGVGERLLGRSAERLIGRDADELGLDSCLEGETPRLLSFAFPGGAGRWELRASTFRERGLPHQLVVLSDLSRALRAEERQAWQRLIRVIGHELNNSLAPIRSLAGSLESLVARAAKDHESDEDMRRGLAIIGARADSLARFMDAYARLAKLPPPLLQATEIGGLVRRVVALETRLAIDLAPGPVLPIQADPDQLEQLLINLFKNAVEAALETGGGVRAGWTKLPAPRDGASPPFLEIWIDDDGPGLSNTANLFVPFFTTKPGGSGIGLVLCRQIAEAHGGSIVLENRRGAGGCTARLRLRV